MSHPPLPTTESFAKACSANGDSATECSAADSSKPAAPRPLPPLLMVRPAGGVLGVDKLEALCRFLRQHGVDELRMPGQGLGVPGLSPEGQTELRDLLGLAPGQDGHSGLIVRGCPGSAGCKNGLQDSTALGQRLEERFGALELPAKVRVGLSGCPRCCGESHVRDLGLVGGKNGWTLLFGGNAGGRPRLADTLAKGLTDDEAVEFVARLLDHYRTHAAKNQRTARFVEAVGIQSIREALGAGE